MSFLLSRLLCWLYMGHFVRRSPYIHMGQMRYWTRVTCWCELLDFSMPGTPTREEAQRRAEEMRALSGWGVR